MKLRPRKEARLSRGNISLTHNNITFANISYIPATVPSASGMIKHLTLMTTYVVGTFVIITMVSIINLVLQVRLEEKSLNLSKIT